MAQNLWLYCSHTCMHTNFTCSFLYTFSKYPYVIILLLSTAKKQTMHPPRPTSFLIITSTLLSHSNISKHLVLSQLFGCFHPKQQPFKPVFMKDKLPNNLFYSPICLFASFFPPCMLFCYMGFYDRQGRLLFLVLLLFFNFCCLIYAGICPELFGGWGVGYKLNKLN